MSFDLTQLRRNLRRQRRQLNYFQQQQAENAIFYTLIRQKKFQSCQNIGIYLHAFGEVHTKKIIQYCFHQKKNVYLPLICNMNQQLRWVKISQHQYYNRRFALHRLGMLEPKASRAMPVQHLDFLIMPLLACDLTGTRIGMGGGFYDRTLAHAPHFPYRVGLAHDLQVIHPPLMREAWDQTLDALITPTLSRNF